MVSYEKEGKRPSSKSGPRPGGSKGTGARGAAEDGDTEVPRRSRALSSASFSGSRGDVCQAGLESSEQGTPERTQARPPAPSPAGLSRARGAVALSTASRRIPQARAVPRAPSRVQGSARCIPRHSHVPRQGRCRPSSSGNPEDLHLAPAHTAAQ